MPLIQITMGKATQETKRALIEKLTAEAVAITQIPASEFTTTILELDYDNLGRAGKTITDIKAAQ